MRLNTNKNSINVLGALNMDLIMNIDTPAKPGETSVGTKFYTAPGGKGGNQAVAAARITKEKSVSFFGIIGEDNYGSQLKKFLEAEKISIIWYNIKYLGCKYSNEVMKMVEESSQYNYC